MQRVRIFLSILVASLVATPTHAQTSPSSSGSAFFVNSDGWAVTNAHVLEGCSRASVPAVGEATDWIIDSQNDVAAVKIGGSFGRPFLSLRGTPPRLGDDIVAFGYPLGEFLSDSVKVTVGNINSSVGMDNDTRYLQISAPIQPGNSGGPVVDHSGAVLGVASAVLGLGFAGHTGVLPQNVNFAVRSNVLEMFLQGNGVKYKKIDLPQDLMQTADLAEKIAPAVLPIFCYKDDNKSTSVDDQVSLAPKNRIDEENDFRNKAINFINEYHEAWSESNIDAMVFMSNAYHGTVEFYGKPISAESVLEEKRNLQSGGQ